MPNRFYPAFSQALLVGSVDMLGSTIRAILVDTDAYTFDADHAFLADIPAEARVGVPQTLADKDVAAGVFTASDISFPAVPPGGDVEALVLYVAGGGEANSRLIGYFDDVEGLPVMPNGGAIDIAWGDNIFSV